MELQQDDRSHGGGQAFACVLCRQRKVKCDRVQPCSNCTKAQAKCTFVAPGGGTGKRARKKRPRLVREGLHAKLRRYERMLEEKYGESLAQPIEHDTSSDSEDSVTTAAHRASQSPGSSLTPLARHDTTGAAAQPPASTHPDRQGLHFQLDCMLWSNIGGSLKLPDNSCINEAAHENGSLLLDWLQQFYPDATTLLHLQRVYTEQFDGKVKMIHLPSLNSNMTAVVSKPGSASKSIEAVLFCFCFATASIMSQEQCQAVFGQDKASAVCKYQELASQALSNAGFAHDPDVTKLQAFSLYLLGAKDLYGRSTVHALSGLAVRLCIRAGLHCDGTDLGLPPFETECRRRLWWHLIHFDLYMSVVLGVRSSLDVFVGSTKPPSNVEDEDIGPDMTEPARERRGLTSLTLLRVRCDIHRFLKRLFLASPSTDACGFNVVGSASVPLKEKERMIAELEDTFESKYLRYCDPSQLLHTFVSIMVRSVICKVRVLVYNPRYFAQKEMRLSASQRDVLFDNASKLLEYTALLRSNPGFHKFLAQTSPTYIWDTIVYVLIAARHRKAGPDIERLFHHIGVLVSSHHSDAFDKAADAIRSALSKWIPEVWEEYTAAARSQGLPVPVRPQYVAEMVMSRENMALSTAPPTDDWIEFSDLDAFATDLNEWLQWDRLLAETDSFQYSFPQI